MVVLFFCLAGAADGMMWFLQFRVAQGYDHKFDGHQFWDPSISWRNKHRSKLPFATTHLVWLTDGFHLMQFIRTVCITVGLSFLVGPLMGVAIMVVYKVWFTVIYKYTFKR
jgi:hypothetical protein